MRRCGRKRDGKAGTSRVYDMGKTARFVLKTVAAGLAFCAFVCLMVGSWSDIYEAAERCRERRMAKRECSDYADEDLYQ